MRLLKRGSLFLGIEFEILEVQGTTIGSSYAHIEWNVGKTEMLGWNGQFDQVARSLTLNLRLLLAVVQVIGCASR